jgi:bifunctional DNase/RNase
MALIGTKPEQDTMAESAEVEVRIRGLLLDPSTQSPVVVLNDVDGDTVLPIWVGIFEANAIALEIEKATLPRPMTHDLLRDVILGLNARVTRVVVGSLEENTFHATIWLDQQGEAVAMDARPSDAIALALRADCPIFVSREVLERAKQNADGAATSTPDDLRRWLENLNDDEMGRYKM